MPLLDHMEIATPNLESMKAFYARILAPLGAAPLVEGPPTGFGNDAGLPFWMHAGDAPKPAIHFAFGCSARAEVDAAFAAAVNAGGSEPRPPKVLPQIGPDYYAAFVRDPDGHLVEFVCRARAGS
jgi:catechol 2,3-dioxygenase-like lactoylglutathione lyase family enzyme